MTATLSLLAAATIPLRNPFWPVGYQGTREAITDAPRIELKTVSDDEAKKDVETSVNPETIAAAKAKAASESELGDGTKRLWAAARKSLHIGSVTKVGGRHAVTINGNVYGDGDCVVVDHDDNRFYWRVLGVSEEGSLKLQRLRIKEIENNDDKGALQ